ncbi:MAG: hypothetical protein AAB585_00810 [Patescibacteria group bacterium]
MKNQLVETDVFKSHAELFQPKEKEMDILKRHEHLADFKIVPYRGISEGRQSKVSVLEYKVEDQSRRVLWKRMGAGRGLSLELAANLHSRLGPYKKELAAYGWNLPILFYTQPVELGTEAQIFSYEELITGGDGEFMVANREEPNFRKWFILHSVLETLAKYPPPSVHRKVVAGQEVSLLPHGLDLKLANVVLNEQGKLYFVDLFGPKEIDNAGHWLSYTTKLDSLPEKNLLAVTATREGAILRFYRLAEKLWSESCEMDVGKIRSGFSDILNGLVLPEVERNFITSQLDSNFSWLDAVYSERQV